MSPEANPALSFKPVRCFILFLNGKFGRAAIKL